MKPLLLIAALCFLAYRWRCREAYRRGCTDGADRALAGVEDSRAALAEYREVQTDTYVAALARKGLACGAVEPGPVTVGVAHTCTLRPGHRGEHGW